MEIVDPLKEEEKLDIEDLLPIHYRILLWVCNHLILYSLLLVSIGGGIVYYLDL